jgi:leucyl aminopeptidase
VHRIAARPPAGPVLGLVGKGVTFDTGGISIKPADGMEDMKFDMAAAPRPSVGADARAGRPQGQGQRRVVAVSAWSRTCPTGSAIKPGDVTSMSGQTIEIINTDAEGRLVLADVLWYAQDRFKPTHIVDLATLTGAMMWSRSAR